MKSRFNIAVLSCIEKVKKWEEDKKTLLTLRLLLNENKILNFFMCDCCNLVSIWQFIAPISFPGNIQLKWQG